MTFEMAYQFSQESQQRANEGITTAISNSQMRDYFEKLKQEVDNLQEDVDSEGKTLQVMVKAATLLSEVTESTVNATLDGIVRTVNSMLQAVFPDDPKSIEITKTLYRETHAHYNVTLKTKQGVIRSFNQSGTGLAQIISFMFTVLLIRQRRGRNILVMDELLNGLHPDAKGIIKGFMQSCVKSGDFQFVCVEYGMDIGKQYQVSKNATQDGLSTVQPWDEADGYYASLVEGGDT